MYNKTTRFLNGNTGNNLEDVGLGNDFLDTILNAQSVKERIDKFIVIKINSFFSLKDIVRRMKRQATYCKKIFAKDIFDKTLLSKYTKC